MKSRVKTLNEMIDAEVKKQVNQARNDIYDEVSEDAARQTIAWFLYYLDTKCGYRAKRLTQTVNGITEVINTETKNGLTAKEIAEYLKDKYEIEL